MSNELIVITETLHAMQPEFSAVLPPQIPSERFMAVARTAIEQDPDLLLADRQSLFLACKRAAQDGLLPDKRQGALVVFNSKSGEKWVKKVQWMPMRQGLIDKAAKYGINIDAQVVHEKDTFSYILGDNPRIEHAPCMKADRGDMLGAYAIATLKDGAKRREFMRKDEIDQAREVSRSKDSGPWKQWYSEMARKTVIRRLFKSLPIVDMSDSDREVFFKDDDIIEGEASEPAVVKGLKEKLQDKLAAPTQDSHTRDALISDLEDAASYGVDNLQKEWKALTKDQRKLLGEAELDRLKGICKAVGGNSELPPTDSYDDLLAANR